MSDVAGGVGRKNGVEEGSMLREGMRQFGALLDRFDSEASASPTSKWPGHRT